MREQDSTKMRKTWPGQVLTAAVLQLFLEVRQALGEPGIGLPRQILAVPWLKHIGQQATLTAAFQDRIGDSGPC